MKYVETESRGYYTANRWEAWQYRKWMHERGQGYVEHEHPAGFKTFCFKRLDMLEECGIDSFQTPLCVETLPRYRERDA